MKLIEGLEATKETVLEVKDAVARATQTGERGGRDVVVVVVMVR